MVTQKAPRGGCFLRHSIEGEETGEVTGTLPEVCLDVVQKLRDYTPSVDTVGHNTFTDLCSSREFLLNRSF